MSEKIKNGIREAIREGKWYGLSDYELREAFPPEKQEEVDLAWLVTRAASGDPDWDLPPKAKTPPNLIAEFAKEIGAEATMDHPGQWTFRPKRQRMPWG